MYLSLRDKSKFKNGPGNPDTGKKLPVKKIQTNTNPTRNEYSEETLNSEKILITKKEKIIKTKLIKKAVNSKENINSKL